MPSLADKLSKLTIKHYDRKKKYKNTHKEQISAWCKAKKSCPFCNKPFTNRHKSDHQKTRKCKIAQGKYVKPRKVRTDKGKKKLKYASLFDVLREKRSSPKKIFSSPRISKRKN